jgi:hypothetical protein
VLISKLPISNSDYLYFMQHYMAIANIENGLPLFVGTLQDQEQGINRLLGLIYDDFLTGEAFSATPGFSLLVQVCLCCSTLVITNFLARRMLWSVLFKAVLESRSSLQAKHFSPVLLFQIPLDRCTPSRASPERS